MKKTLVILPFFLISFSIFSEGSLNQKKFISGNLLDKTESVKQASGQESILLSKMALDFVIENKDILGNDRDLDTLAVSGVLALPSDYMNSASIEEKTLIAECFYQIYNLFENINVKTAILNRLTVFHFSDDRFASLLNDYLKKTEIIREKDPLTKSIISTLGYIGNDDSFVILYIMYSDSAWSGYKEELNKSITMLFEQSIPQALSIIQSGSYTDGRLLFDLAIKNEKLSNKIVAEISENVISRTINLYESSLSTGNEISQLQYDAYTVLTKLKWTRAAGTAMKFFVCAKKEYEEGSFPEDNFVKVIKNLPVIDPLDSVQSFCSYIAECNAIMEKSLTEKDVKKPSDKVMLALISALGAIGDKNAFDTLLAVTYYTYSETVITQARDALASLKW